MSDMEKDEAQLPDNVKYSDLVVHVGNIDRNGTESEFAAFLNGINLNHSLGELCAPLRQQQP